MKKYVVAFMFCVLLVACGSEKSKNYVTTTIAGLNATVTAQQDRDTGDVTVTVTESNNTNESISSLSFAVTKELANGARISIPVSGTSSPLLIQYAPSPLLTATTLDDAVKLDIEVTVRTDQGRSFQAPTASLTITRMPGVVVSYEVRQHPNFAGMLQVVLTRVGTRAIPDDVAIAADITGIAGNGSETLLVGNSNIQVPGGCSTRPYASSEFSTIRIRIGGVSFFTATTLTFPAGTAVNTPTDVFINTP